MSCQQTQDEDEAINYEKLKEALIESFTYLLHGLSPQNQNAEEAQMCEVILDYVQALVSNSD